MLCITLDGNTWFMSAVLCFLKEKSHFCIKKQTVEVLKNG